MTRGPRVFHRYRNIWPFEHARVRLKKQKPQERPSGKFPTPFSNSIPGSLHPIILPQPADFLPPVTLSLSSARDIQLPLFTPAVSSSADDYVNASYVQPLGTKKRYIATQGPLPETFNDFWLCVYQSPFSSLLPRCLTSNPQASMGTECTRHCHAHSRGRGNNDQVWQLLVQQGLWATPLGGARSQRCHRGVREVGSQGTW